VYGSLASFLMIDSLLLSLLSFRRINISKNEYPNNFKLNLEYNYTGNIEKYYALEKVTLGTGIDFLMTGLEYATSATGSVYSLKRQLVQSSEYLYKDDGTYIRTACKILLNYGICDESIHPYTQKNISNYDILTPVKTFQNLKLFTKFQYIFIKQDIDSIKAALSNYNSPIIFGFLVYDSFYNTAVSNTGFVPNPNTRQETLQGGHCMNIIGYNDNNQYFICANSWGTSWGANGYCYIPYDFLLNPNLAFDFCVLSLEL